MGRNQALVIVAILGAALLGACRDAGRPPSRETQTNTQTGGPAEPGQGYQEGKVYWGPHYYSLRYNAYGLEFEYPEWMINKPFGPPGQAPEIVFKKDWPIVTMRARWVVSTEKWPEKYRDNALNLIVMRAADATLYEHLYPETVRQSRFTTPPQFRELAEGVGPAPLIDRLRGNSVQYEVLCKGGFGAKDFTIQARIKAGASEDGKTLFYYDRPDYISKHFRALEYVFAVRDEGDTARFEVWMACECTPRRMFRGETMNRTEQQGRYYVERLFETFSNPPTEKQIDDYVRQLKEKYRLTIELGKPKEPLIVPEDE